MQYKLAVLSLLAVISAGVVISLLYTVSRPAEVVVTEVSAAQPDNTQPDPKNFTEMGTPFTYTPQQPGDPNVTPVANPDGSVHMMY